MKHVSSIEPLEARIAPATFTVTNDLDSGANTLRQAILDANAAAGADIIQINSDVTVTSPLPAIVEKVTINGGLSTISGTGVMGSGLVFSGAMHAGSSVDALSIYGFGGDGLVFANAGGNTAHFVVVQGVGGSGIKLTSPNNSLDFCFLFGNMTDGIRLETQAANGNTITGSFIGQQPDGGIFVSTAPNGGDGIHLVDAANSLIKDNHIGGNGANGVHISGAGSTGNNVRGNEIGNSAAQIGANGVLLDGGVLTTIGGLSGLDGNEIINCALNGVRVTGSANAAIVGNTYSSSVLGLPIDVGGDGLTPNDVGTPPDTDSGPNGLQNFPLITQAVSLSGNSYVVGELRSTPSSTFYIETFARFGGRGNGMIVGGISVTTDADGLATFTQSFPKGLLTDGAVVYTTATSASGTGATSDSAPVTFATGTEFVKLSGLRSASFIDADGDPVKITATNGVFDFDNFALIPSGKGAHLEILALDAGFNRASVTITAGKAKGGDGFVNVTSITADEADLDALMVDGDLSHLNVGRPNITQSLDKLIVHSLGVVGDIDFPEVIALGGIGSISVLGDVKDFIIQLGGGLYRDLTVKGSLSNLDFTAHSLGSLNVKGDILNSNITTERGAIGNVTVGGSILDTTNGSGIHAATTLGAIVVKHDIASNGMGRISITAGGILNPPADDTSLTIRSVKTGGSVINTDVLAGYDAQLTAVNRSVHIGALAIGGNWMASNVVAGIARGMDGLFGTADDAPIDPGTMGSFSISRIASVVIKGTVTGGGMAKFVFEADQIGSFKFGSTVLQLTNGADDFPVGSATDVHVREL
jgi:hypothetical protein